MKKLLVMMIMLSITGCAGTKAMQSASNEADIHVSLGLNDLTKGDATTAKTELLQAEKLAPQSARVQVALGYYSWQVGEMKNADAHYQQAIKMASNDPEVLNDYGVFLCETGREQEAIPYFLKAVQIPTFTHAAQAYYNAGLCADQIEDPEATTYFARAKQEDAHIESDFQD